MRIRKKISVCFLAGAAVAAALLTAAFTLAPAYLNSPAVKNKIEAVVSKRLGGAVSYGKIDLSFFPRPHVSITKLKLRYPRTFRGTLQSLILYPQILPLFSGELRFAKIRIIEPDFRVILPAAFSKSTEEAPSVEEVKEDIRAVLRYLEAIGAGLVTEMDNGKFLISRSRRDFLSLGNVTVRFNAPPGDIKVMVKASTDRWGDFVLRGTYSFSEEKTELRDLAISMGHSSLTGFSSVLHWDGTPRLEVLSGSAAVALDEIYSWLSSSESLTPFLRHVRLQHGVLIISSLQGGGPVDHPEAWTGEITGEVKDVLAESHWLPARLSVSTRFRINDNSLEVAGLSARLGASSLSDVSASITGRAKPVLEIHSARAFVHGGELFQWRSRSPALGAALGGVDDLQGNLTISSLTFKGPLLHPEAGRVTAGGGLDHVIVSALILPGPIGLLKGNFRYVSDDLSFSLREATVLDSSLTGTALISGITGTVRSIDLALNGGSGRKTLDWVFERLQLPPDLMIKTPIVVRNSHLAWNRKTGVKFSGTISVAEGLSFLVDLTQHETDLDIRRLAIRDRDTNAALTLNWRKQKADITYSGIMAQSTLSRLFEQGNFGAGAMHGDIDAVIRTDQPLKSRINGNLAGRGIFIPWGMRIPTTIDQFTLQADGDVLTVDSADVTWGENHYSLNGAATASDEGIAFSMTLKADGIDIQAIQKALERPGEKDAGQKKTRSFPLPPIRGDLRADSAYVKFGRFTFAPAHAVILVDPARVTMEFYDTRTCGISLKGSTVISRESVSFAFAPSAKKENLGPTMDCLAGKDVHITGEYDLDARINAQGKAGELFSALEGRVDFKARNGKIYHYPLLQKIFSVLSVLDVFRGRIPEIGGSGFPYHSMAIRGDIHKGRFTVEKAYIGGQSLDIIASGEVDLGAKKIDLVVLVAPFSTLNWIIRHIPLVGKIMGGTLISIPVKVSGDLADPDVTFLAPSAVGSRIVELLKNILELPIELISPILPKEKEERE
ncbi:MAG TPA: AsmA-like C-terminal domain-containing protein [Nitrospirota bacterium]